MIGKDSLSMVLGGLFVYICGFLAGWASYLSDDHLMDDMIVKDRGSFVCCFISIRFCYG